MSQVLREQLKVAAERAILVGVQLPGAFFDREDPFSELRSLAVTAGAMVVGEMTQKRAKPNGRTYLGKGKVEELAGLVRMTDASLIIFDNDLSPKQIKAIEEATECKIIDRSELILDIFAGRATTHMAKLQVEIAQLQYTYPRLRAMWAHLERIVGGSPVGIGTRGPGEKQLETDRRIVQRRLAGLKAELAEMKARKTREVAQRNLDHFTVGLVGYTNAGKSTLFNRLTAGGAFAHNKLFATLSTRVERWDLGGGNHVMLSDTVGFIRNLPHHLVASFRSTLEETVHAQLLLVLLDASDPHATMQFDTVMETLDEIGTDQQPRILLLNKIDQIGGADEVLVLLNQFPQALPISATTGQGIEELAAVVKRHMLGEVKEVAISLPLKDARALDYLEKRTEVLDRAYDGDRATLRVRIGRRQIDHLLTHTRAMRIDGEAAHDALPNIWPERIAEDAIRVPPHERWAS